MIMKKALFLSVALLSTAAVAQAPSDATSSEESYDPNQRICRNMGETGSRLSRTRVCMTRAEWEARRREARQNVERAQTTRAERPSGP